MDSSPSTDNLLRPTGYRRGSAPKPPAYGATKLGFDEKPEADYSSDFEDSDEEQVKAEISEKVLPRWKKYRGILLALQSSLVFSLTALIVKLYKGRYSPVTISLWRYQGALWPTIPFMVYHRYYGDRPEKVFDAISPLSDPPKLKIFFLLVARSVLTCNALLMHFMSLDYLEVGDALVISSSTPVFVTIFAYFFLGEASGFIPIITAIMTIFGVGIIIKPPLLTGAEEFDQQTLIGTALGLGCMIITCVSFVCLRSLRKVHYTCTMLAFGIWGTIENGVVAYYSGVLEGPETSEHWLITAGLTSLTFIGQIAIIVALKCEAAGPVALVRTCDVIFAYAWQIIFLRRIPDIFSIIGASIVVAGVFITTLRKYVATLPEAHPSKLRFRYLLK